MKVTIIGAGAVGCLLGGLLGRNNQVTMVGRKEQLEALANGIRIEGAENLLTKVAAVDDARMLSIQDAVIITVKAHDTFQALQDCRRLIGPGTLLLVVQNGLDVLNVADRVGFARMNIGVASLGVTYLRPAHVRYAGKGRIIIGNIEGRKGAATRWVQLLKGSGMDAAVSNDILKDVWRKVAINAAVNPITALVKLPNNCIAEDDGLLMLSKQLFQEAAMVGQWWRALEPNDVSYDDVMRVIGSTGTNRSSMLQDVERGKRTEIDSINGAICRRAPNEGMVSANRTVWALVRSLEKCRL
jgi:2-dehydropantoate 2-reductase